MSPRNAPPQERPAIGLRIVATVLAMLPFGWMLGISDGELNASEADWVEPAGQVAEAVERATADFLVQELPGDE